MNDALREELAAFWRRYGAIADPAELRRRADEVVCIARDPAGELAAVNSVYVGELAGTPHYFYRQFVRPDERTWALSASLVRTASAHLRSSYRPGNAVSGLVLVAENAKLSRPGAKELLARLGWVHVGKEQRGLDVWKIAF
jgi:hypothetical protein